MAGWGERPREPERPSAMVAVRNAPAILHPRLFSDFPLSAFQPPAFRFCPLPAG